MKINMYLIWPNARRIHALKLRQSQRLHDKQIKQKPVSEIKAEATAEEATAALSSVACNIRT